MILFERLQVLQVKRERKRSALLHPNKLIVARVRHETKVRKRDQCGARVVLAVDLEWNNAIGR